MQAFKDYLETQIHLPHYTNNAEDSFRRFHETFIRI